MNYGKKNASKRQKEITSKSTMQKKKIGSRLFKSFVICILLIGIAGIAGVSYLIKSVIDNAPNITPESVKPTEYTTFVVDQDGNELDRFVQSGSNRIYKTNEEIPQYLRDAFVAIEDERFYSHNGIDIKGIIRAGVVTVTSLGKRTEGASTITQQLIKNTVFPDFVHEDGLLEKFERKFQEQYLALEIEKQMTKEQILENYMNTINLGQSTLGVQAASMRYFGKDVSELTLSECATIAGITQNPGTYNPITNPDKNKERRTKVLDNMLELGFINQDEYDQAMADDVYARIQTVNQEQESNPTTYFIDALAEQVIEDLQKEPLNYTEAQAHNALYSGGLKIYATQDAKIQKIVDEEINDDDNYPSRVEVGVSYALTITRADGTQDNYSSWDLKKFGKEKYGDKQGRLFKTEEAAQKRIDEFKASVAEEGDVRYDENKEFTPQPQASIVVMDQKTGQVKAISGGRGDKKSSRSLNRATDTKEQPGSSFKIVGVYAAALDAGGESLGTVTKDEPMTVGGKTFKNAYSGYKGNVTMRTAIEDSVNISALKTWQNVTPQLCMEYIQKLGIDSIVTAEEGKQRSDKKNDLNLSTALGGLTDGVHNIEMSGAYAAIANGGVYNRPVYYTKIEDHDGNVLIDNSGESKTVLRESTAYLLTSAMEDVITKGTGYQAKLSNMAAAGKTGTTTDRWDIWFCGYTPYYTCTVWVGYDDNKELPLGNYNQILWKAVMSRIHEDLPYKDFEMPDTVKKMKVCSISGKVASSTCPYHMEYMATDGGGDKVCTSHSGYEGSVGGTSPKTDDDDDEDTTDTNTDNENTNTDNNTNSDDNTDNNTDNNNGNNNGNNSGDNNSGNNGGNSGGNSGGDNSGNNGGSNGDNNGGNSGNNGGDNSGNNGGNNGGSNGGNSGNNGGTSPTP